MSIRAKNINVWLAGLLIIAILSISFAAIPRPSRAASGCIAGLLSAIGIGAGTAAVASAVGLSVPVLDATNLVQNTATAGATTGLKVKACQDEIMTAVLKTVINLVRDMVIRWIVTGRFEGPVFSQSFSIDAAKTAENASRIFLSKLTGVNFCGFIGTPSIQSFAISADLGLSCTLPGNIDQNYTDTIIRLATDPSSLSYEERWALDSPQNQAVYNYIQLVDERDKAIARSLIAQSAEYVAGRGFFGIRDENTGLIKIPASYTAKLAEVAGIESPQRQADVANTVQQAITAIIDTAIRTLLEKGLAKIGS